jgi:hypothetical protein
MKVKAVCPPETLVPAYDITQELHSANTHHCDKLKSLLMNMFLWISYKRINFAQ